MKNYRAVGMSELVQSEPNARFIAMLEEFSPEQESAVRKCRKRYSTWTDGDHKFHRVSLCRKRNLCPVDAKVYAYGLADDAIEVIHSIYSKVGGKLEFTVIDFSLPRDMRNKIGLEELPELRSIGWSVIVDVLGEDSLKLGGVGVYQWWSTGDPMSGPLPHLHMTLFNMAFKDGKRVSIPVYILAEKLGEMKGLWRQRVEARWGASRYSATSKSWVVFAHYSRGYGHLRHRLAYAFRYPVVDLYKALGGRGYMSCPPDGWLKQMLLRPKKEKRIQWFGWMSQRFIYEYAKSLDVEIPRKREREKEMRKVFCPYCGKELQKVGEGLTREEIEPGGLLLVFDGGGGFVG